MAATERRSIWFFTIPVVVVALDQLSKHWALNRLSGGRTIDVVWTLRFSLGRNSGMAFSQGEGLGVLIGLFALAASVVLVVLVRRSPSPQTSIGYAMILGGALGNVVDRLFRDDAWLRGHVVDFIDLQWFPSFNIADSFITVGATTAVVMMVLDSSAR